MTAKPNLDDYSDQHVFRVCAEESPEFADILSKLIDDGKTDEEIIRMVAAANGSGQCMHYAKKCLRVLRKI